MKTNPTASNAPKGKGKGPESEEPVTYYLFRDEAGRLHFSQNAPEAGLVCSAAAQPIAIPDGLPAERQAANGQLLALQEELVSLIFRACLEGTAPVRGELGRTLLAIRSVITVLASPDTADQG